MGQSQAKHNEATLHNYRLGDRIGDGAFSDVYKATRKTDNKPVAVKVIYKSRQKTLKEKSKEIEVLKLVHHENVAELYEIIETKRCTYVISELLEGPRLFESIVWKGKYSEPEAAYVAHQLASALTYLHSLRIVHRDLKPENIIYLSNDPLSPVKLIDFGLASTLSPGHNLLFYCGSPHYMAPEMVRQEPYAFPIDMWAFGVITYCLLAGKHPFHDQRRDTLFNMIEVQDVKFTAQNFSHLSDQAKDFMQRLLEKDPYQRMTAEEALNHPWLQLRFQFINSTKKSSQLVVPDHNGSNPSVLNKADSKSKTQQQQQNSTANSSTSSLATTTISSPSTSSSSSSTATTTTHSPLPGVIISASSASSTRSSSNSSTPRNSHQVDLVDISA